MSTQEEKIAIVKRGVEAFAKVETNLEGIHEGLLELESVYKDGGKAGMANEAEIISTVQKLRKLTGQSAAVGEEVYALHQRATKLAKDNDADVALPEGFAVVYGGGGR